MIRRFLFLAALSASAPSWSAVTLSNFPPNPGVLPGGGWQFTSGTTFANPTPARAWVNGVYGGVPAAVVTDTMALTGPAGKLTVAVSTAATAASIAKALAGVAGRLYAPLTVGMAAYDLLSAVRVRQGESGAEMDPGAPPTPRTVYSTGGVSDTSDSAACALYAKSNAAYAGTYEVFVDGYPVRYTYESRPRVFFGPDTYGTRLYCYVDVYRKDGTLHSLKYRTEPINSSVESSSCTEAATGALMPTGADGKCPTGRYESATQSAVISAVTPSVQKNLASSAKAAVDAGASIDASPPAVSGPASQTGTPVTTTTTGPTGTTSTTTTPTYNYTYQGDTITINTTNTTTTNVTNIDGDTTTTTKTETKPGTDDEGMCAKYPDSLACMKPGTPPDAEQIPIDRRPVTITKDPRWAANAGACTRGAIQLTSGVSINLWQPFCDFFALIRGVVVGMFGLAAAFIFRNGVK